MKVCKVSDYETAFDFLVAWLKETHDMVGDNMPSPSEELDFEMANGYLMCCRTAILLAEDLRNKIMRAGRGKND